VGSAGGGGGVVFGAGVAATAGAGAGGGLADDDAPADTGVSEADAWVLSEAYCSRAPPEKRRSRFEAVG
jgi:hypothetical protein